MLSTIEILANFFVKLSEKVDQQVANPVLLSAKKPRDLFGESVTIAGWGYTNLIRHKPSRYLQKANVIVRSDDTCKKSTDWKQLFRMTNNLSVKYNDCFCSQAEPYILFDCVSIKKNSTLAKSFDCTL